MKLSKDTLMVLQNFAAINQSIFIKPGKELRTATIGKDIVAIAQIQDDFPMAVPVFDLGRLLSTLSLFKEPDIEFGDKALTIKSNRSRVRYLYSSEALVVKPMEGTPKFTVLASFQLEPSLLNETLKAAGVLGVPDITITSFGEGISLIAHNKKEGSSDNFVSTVGASETKFVVDINVEKIKLLPLPYTVEVCKSGNGRLVVHFKGHAISYFVAAEATSKII